jgi:hypothetical protein
LLAVARFVRSEWRHFMRSWTADTRSVTKHDPPDTDRITPLTKKSERFQRRFSRGASSNLFEDGVELGAEEVCDIGLLVAAIQRSLWRVEARTWRNIGDG